MGRRAVVAGACALVAVFAGWGHQGAGATEGETVGTTFPDGFPVIDDASLGTPVLGFGAAGPVERTPVILLHGNNDTPYPTDCNGAYGKILDLAQFLVDSGYSPSEVWALGYQGDQCDLVTDQTRRAGEAHTTVANVPDLRRFVEAVLAFTGANQVDVIGHSLGTTLTREWLRQDQSYDKVRRLVGVDGPNHGIINCSPNPRNYYHSIGFVPDSPVCLEYGSADTPLLAALNAGDETPGPTEYLMIVNADVSFVYIEAQDGTLPPVPSEDRLGRPHDFSQSARLEGAELVELTGQGVHDKALLAAHTGIIASPHAWAAALEFLTRPSAAATAPAAPAGGAGPAPTSSGEIPATGGGGHPLVALVLLASATAAWRMTAAGGPSGEGSRTPRAAGFDVTT